MRRHNMALKQKWKKAGKDTGEAFANLGKSTGKTAKVVFTDEKNDIEPNGRRKLSNSWRKTGKSFGKAGKSVGKALQGTAQKILDVEKEETDDTVVEETTEVVDETKE